MPADLQATIDASCRELESTAAAMGVNLALVPASVPALESLLSALRELGADEGTMTGATFMIGAYLGEILRRARGGSWCSSLAGDLLVEISGATYAPVAKVRKFAADLGGGDGLVFYTSVVLGGGA